MRRRWRAPCVSIAAIGSFLVPRRLSRVYCVPVLRGSPKCWCLNVVCWVQRVHACQWLAWRGSLAFACVERATGPCRVERQECVVSWAFSSGASRFDQAVQVPSFHESWVWSKTELSGTGSCSSKVVRDLVYRVRSISGKFLARHHGCSNRLLNYWCEGVVTVRVVDNKSPMSSLDPWIIVVIG